MTKKWLLLLAAIFVSCWSLKAQDFSHAWEDALKHEAASPHFTIQVTVSAPGNGIDRAQGTIVVDQTFLDFLMHACKTDLFDKPMSCDTAPATFVLDEALKRIGTGNGIWWPITLSPAQ